MVTGVILCAEAGGKNTRMPGATGARFRKGLAIAILGGVLAPTLNFGIQYGISLLIPGGSGQAGDPFPVRTYLAWAVFLSASAVVQAAYCLSRVLANKSAAAFRPPGGLRGALQGLAMSSVWISRGLLYGRSGLGPCT